MITFNYLSRLMSESDSSKPLTLIKTRPTNRGYEAHLVSPADFNHLVNDMIAHRASEGYGTTPELTKKGKKSVYLGDRGSSKEEEEEEGGDKKVKWFPDIEYWKSFKVEINRYVTEVLKLFEFDENKRKIPYSGDIYNQMMKMCAKVKGQTNSKMYLPDLFADSFVRLFSTERSSKAAGGAGGKRGRPGVLYPDSELNKEFIAKFSMKSQDSSGNNVKHIDPSKFDEAIKTLIGYTENAAKTVITNQYKRSKKVRSFTDMVKSRASGEGEEFDFAYVKGASSKEKSSIGKVALENNFSENLKQYIKTEDKAFLDRAKKLWNDILASSKPNIFDKDDEPWEITHKEKWSKFMSEVEELMDKKNPKYSPATARKELEELEKLGIGDSKDFRVGYTSTRQKETAEKYNALISRKINDYVKFYQIISDQSFIKELEKEASENLDDYEKHYSIKDVQEKFIKTRKINNTVSISNYVEDDLVSFIMRKNGTTFKRVNYANELLKIQNYIQQYIESKYKKTPAPAFGNIAKGFKESIEKYKEADKILPVYLGEVQASVEELVDQTGFKKRRIEQLVDVINNIKNQIAGDIIPSKDLDATSSDETEPSKTYELDPSSKPSDFAKMQAKEVKKRDEDEEKKKAQLEKDIKKVEELEKEDNERVARGEPRMYIKGENLPVGQRGDDIDLGERGTYLGDLSNFGIPLQPLANLRKRIQALGKLVSTVPTSAKMSLSKDYRQDSEFETEPYSIRPSGLAFSPTDPEYRDYPYSDKSPVKVTPIAKKGPGYSLVPYKLGGLTRSYDAIMKMFPDINMTYSPPKATEKPVPTTSQPSRIPMGDIKNRIEPLRSSPNKPFAMSFIGPSPISDEERKNYPSYENRFNPKGKWKSLLEHMIQTRFPWMK